jgi:hypothetical protein
VEGRVTCSVAADKPVGGRRFNFSMVYDHNLWTSTFVVKEEERAGISRQ